MSDIVIEIFSDEEQHGPPATLRAPTKVLPPPPLLEEDDEIVIEDEGHKSDPSPSPASLALPRAPRPAPSRRESPEEPLPLRDRLDACTQKLSKIEKLRMLQLRASQPSAPTNTTAPSTSTAAHANTAPARPSTDSQQPTQAAPATAWDLPASLPRAARLPAVPEAGPPSTSRRQQQQEGEEEEEEEEEVLVLSGSEDEGGMQWGKTVQDDHDELMRRILRGSDALIRPSPCRPSARLPPPTDDDVYGAPSPPSRAAARGTKRKASRGARYEDDDYEWIGEEGCVEEEEEEEDWGEGEERRRRSLGAEEGGAGPSGGKKRAKSSTTGGGGRKRLTDEDRERAAREKQEAKEQRARERAQVREDKRTQKDAERREKDAGKVRSGAMAFQEVRVVFSTTEKTFRAAMDELDNNDRQPDATGGRLKPGHLPLRYLSDQGQRAEFQSLRPFPCFLWERCELEGEDLGEQRRQKRAASQNPTQEATGGGAGAGAAEGMKLIKERIESMEHRPLPMVWVLLTGDQFGALAREDRFPSLVRDFALRCPHASLGLLVVGLQQTLNVARNKDRGLEPIVETAKAKLLTQFKGVYARYCADDKEAAEFILDATRWAALQPYYRPLTRAEVEEKTTDKTRGGVLDQMRKAGVTEPGDVDAMLSWVQMLQRIPRMGQRAAVSIAKAYPTPFALLSAYQDPRLSVAQKQNLLAGLRPPSGGNAVGPVMSARVYVFFTLKGGDALDAAEEGQAQAQRQGGAGAAGAEGGSGRGGGSAGGAAGGGRLPL